MTNREKIIEAIDKGFSNFDSYTITNIKADIADAILEALEIDKPEIDYSHECHVLLDENYRLREKLKELEKAEEWKCPHCGSTKGTWFNRDAGDSLESFGATICIDCGENVDEKPQMPEWEKRFDDKGEGGKWISIGLAKNIIRQELKDMGEEITKPRNATEIAFWGELGDNLIQTRVNIALKKRGIE